MSVVNCERFKNYIFMRKYVTVHKLECLISTWSFFTIDEYFENVYNYPMWIYKLNELGCKRILFKNRLVMRISKYKYIYFIMLCILRFRKILNFNKQVNIAWNYAFNQ